MVLWMLTVSICLLEITFQKKAIHNKSPALDTETKNILYANRDIE